MRTVIKTFVFKLYRSARNRHLHRQINAAGLTWNHCIALHKRYYRLFHKSLNLYQLQKHLAKIKYLPRFSYLLEYGSQAVQNVAERINKAYQKFYADRKRKVKTSLPKFRKIRKYKSFTLKQAGWKLLDGNRIRINGRVYKFWKSREIEGKVKTLTVKRDALGDIYIYLACEIDAPQVAVRSGKSVGYDFGCGTFLTSSKGEKEDIPMPEFFKENSKLMRKLQRALSRCVKGSHNRERCRLAVARLWKRITNQRHDFHFKKAREICEKYAIVCLEDLNLKGIAARHGKKVGEYGFGYFVDILKYIATKFGSTVAQVDRFFPSSQICHVCGYQNPNTKNLKIREWDCPNCGAHHDRDRNAAINIERQSVVFLGLEMLRPEQSGCLA